MDKISVSIKTSPQMTISKCIADNKRHLIQELKVVGLYQSRYDNDTIRNMCNCTTVNGIRSGGQLEVLDLADAEIVESHNGINKYNAGSLWSSNSLNECITLREIKFGKSLTSISGRHFADCISLKKIDVTDNPIYTSINGILYQRADNCDWTVSVRRPFNEGEWILIKVPAAINDSKLIRFDKINRISSGAFKNTSLKTLVMSSIPPTCDSDGFDNVDIQNITIFVPKDSFNSYWCHPIWGKFNIKVI